MKNHVWGAVRLYSVGGCRRIVRLSKHLRNFSKRRGKGELVKQRRKRRRGANSRKGRGEKGDAISKKEEVGTMPAQGRADLEPPSAPNADGKEGVVILIVIPFSAEDCSSRF